MNNLILSGILIFISFIILQIQKANTDNHSIQAICQITILILTGVVLYLNFIELRDLFNTLKVI